MIPSSPALGTQSALDQIPQQPLPEVAAFPIATVETKDFDLVVFGNADDRQKRHAIHAIGSTHLEIRAVEEEKCEASIGQRTVTEPIELAADVRDHPRDLLARDLLAGMVQTDTLDVARREAGEKQFGDERFQLGRSPHAGGNSFV
jgi:hypothetical protein